MRRSSATKIPFQYNGKYTAGDVHLKSGSPAIGAATTRDAPSSDADRKPRANPYDAGAYEF